MRLKDWSERTTPETRLRGLLGSLGQRLASIPDAVAFPFIPPTLPGFGSAGGFSFVLQDRSGTLSIKDFGAQVAAFMAEARRRPEITSLFTAFDPNVPQVDLTIDREKVSKLGIPITDVFNTLQATLGGASVNDFNRFGRLYRVFVQSEARFRQKPEDIGQFYVRSTTTGAMVPLSTLVSTRQDSGAEMTVRYNLYRSAEITGRPALGYSSAQALTALEETAIQVLPREAKNAILIVEFAKAKREGGQSLFDAAIEAAKLRFRPILIIPWA